MANRLAEARRSLLKAKEATNRRLTELDEERRELKASIKSLDAAIRALGTQGATKKKNVVGIETDPSRLPERGDVPE